MRRILNPGKTEHCQLSSRNSFLVMRDSAAFNHTHCTLTRRRATWALLILCPECTSQVVALRGGLDRDACSPDAEGGRWR